MTETTDGSLRANWFHILAALANQDMHGSAIVRDVLDQTEGSLHLWPATLYRTLDDMVAAKLIVELQGNRRPEGESEKRRYYRVTPLGRSQLATAADRMADLAGIARRRLRGTAK